MLSLYGMVLGSAGIAAFGYVSELRPPLVPRLTVRLPLALVQVDIWFKEGPLDMAWVGRFVGSVAVVFSRSERWHTLVQVGRAWSRLSEGAFNERILPWLLQVGGWGGRVGGWRCLCGYV